VSGEALILLSRPGCQLCEEFLAELGAEFPQLLARVRIEDVDRRDDWKRRYGLRIPVLLDADGERICEARFDAERLRRALGVNG
jgi:hypothetical protein